MNICLICGRNASNDRWKICFECWKDLGQPRNKEELQAALDKRPNLILELKRKYDN